MAEDSMGSPQAQHRQFSLPFYHALPTFPFVSLLPTLAKPNKPCLKSYIIPSVQG